MNLKKTLWTVISLVVIGLLVWPKLKFDPDSGTSKSPAGKGMPVKVSVYKASYQTTENYIDVTGSVIATEEVELRSEIQGRVVSINFNEGSKVTKGQMLVKINDADLRAQLKRASALLNLKKETESRNKNLLEKGGVSTEVYEQSKAEFDAAIADVDLIKEQIRKTEIIAPFTGVIGLRYISEGGYVTNSSIIASLHTLDKVKIEFSVPEKYAGKVHKGSVIRFTTEGHNEEVSADVYAIEPKVDPATRNVTMRAICNNQDGKLFPGAFAKVKVNLGKDNNILMIPTQSVVPVLKGQKVFVVFGDSAVEKKIITGTRGEKFIEVKEGLSEGDNVVVKGVMYMRQGTKVIITPSENNN